MKTTWTYEEIEKIQSKATEYMNSKLGCIFYPHVKAEFTFENGGVATVSRDYIGSSDHMYKLEYEGDVLCETKNPYTCGWALYVLGCGERGVA